MAPYKLLALTSLLSAQSTAATKKHLPEDATFNRFLNGDESMSVAATVDIAAIESGQKPSGTFIDLTITGIPASSDSVDVVEPAAQNENSSCPPWDTFGTISQAVGRRTISLSDSNRGNRTINVDIWYPAMNGGESMTQYLPPLSHEGKYSALDNPIVASPTNGDDGYFPLLIFSHGKESMRQQSATLMEHLASWGFVVASPDHPGDSRSGGGDGILYPTLERPKDISFVIDSLLSLSYVDQFHLNVNKGVGVLGHSYGGHTALAVAPEGQLSDDRVKAIMPIAPAVVFDGLPDDIEYLSNITVPILVIGGINDTVTPVYPNNDVVFKKPRGLPRWNVVVGNAGHSSFAEACIMFEVISSAFGDENMAYSIIGGGDIDQGKAFVEHSLCETNKLAQTILAYYAVSFFYATLIMKDDDNEKRKAKECMAEQAKKFQLSSFDFLDDLATDAVIPNTADTEAAVVKPSSASVSAKPIVEIVVALFVLSGVLV